MSGIFVQVKRVVCAASLLLLVFGVVVTTAQAEAPPTTYRTYFQDPGPEPVPRTSRWRTTRSQLIDATPPGEQHHLRVPGLQPQHRRRRIDRARTSAACSSTESSTEASGAARSCGNLVAAIGPSTGRHLRHPVVRLTTRASRTRSSAAESLHAQQVPDVLRARPTDGSTSCSRHRRTSYRPVSSATTTTWSRSRATWLLYDAYVDVPSRSSKPRCAHERPRPSSSPADDGRQHRRSPPRARQPDLNTDDTIVEQLSEIDCCGRPGRIRRRASIAFRSERGGHHAQAGRAPPRRDATSTIIVSNADGDIIAGLVSRRHHRCTRSS